MPTFIPRRRIELGAAKRKKSNGTKVSTTYIIFYASIGTCTFVFHSQSTKHKAQKQNLQFAVFMNFLLGALLRRIVHLHNSSLVATAVTVIWRREDGDNRSIVLPLVALHDKLMCTCYEIKTVNMSELLRNILTECVSGTPWRNTPSAPEREREHIGILI